MSDQSFGQPLSQTVPPAKGARRKGTLGVGVLLLLGGVGGGAALFANATSQYKEAITNLQRAPVGCDTELDFTGTGTFTFYVETKGKVGKLRGDCENTETDYARPAGAALPVVALTLTDSDGNEVALTRTKGSSYDAGGFVGTAVRKTTTSKPATYTLSVDSEDSDFSVAIGRDPKSDFDKAKLIALGMAGAGLIVGGLLMVLGLRRKAAGTITMGPFGGTSDGTPVHNVDGQLAPPLWEPAAPQPEPWQPEPPQPQQPHPPLPPPTWQPPHPDESGSGWSAPR